jgi:hypothetical protein
MNSLQKHPVGELRRLGLLDIQTGIIVLIQIRNGQGRPGRAKQGEGRKTQQFHPKILHKVTRHNTTERPNPSLRHAKTKHRADSLQQA